MRNQKLRNFMEKKSQIHMCDTKNTKDMCVCRDGYSMPYKLTSSF
jgi:hypothetical protein